MNRRGLFGLLSGAAVAAALPLAKRVTEASGYTVLKLDHSWPIGTSMTVIHFRPGEWATFGSPQTTLNGVRIIKAAP